MADRVEDAIVACSAAQRAAIIGEPICALCGRYGAYVCDATDEDAAPPPVGCARSWG
ncbi:hypothetical protein SPRG_15377 [Saprolegnia parasitica CBS 223.65]|uniref:Uncharacterized protein n=1 Tax=Saprolegnia parasitica (strain CBS 223.65) TaxID=695850 RepID=A0A067BMJ3_SAPPC|nr:hypothetical protein SPRG_15377 [Saprolegnia parasitica CBS 223.65]KDO17970.1 hypothetical protein SPRG_15377 [Saprolegnia parasitica CBS 223.65]|eukprot:XP_012211328.1 hypothetical protein SPRG_15377 [Saprolegnia parasitica CBS 223.65]